MNKRIKELREQALIMVSDEQRDRGELYDTRELWDRHDQKFAELIVRECINKIETYDLTPGHSAKWEDIYEIHARLLQNLGEELKEHFGIES
jgi:hypothetical protein